jgi:hypothetical protein
VVSLRQTEYGKVQGQDLPLSDPIQPLIDRINWAWAWKARMSYWDNKLYVAVPLDDAAVKRVIEPDWRYGGPDYAGHYHPIVGEDAGVSWTNLKPGVIYQWRKGPNEWLLDGNAVGFPFFLDTPGAVNASGYFVPQGTGATVQCLAGVTGPENAPPFTGELSQQIQGVNNCILVYDFLNQKWCGRDTGYGLPVAEFFKAQWGGEQRLFFIGEDGYINLVEGAEEGDHLGGQEFLPINSRARTRAYQTGKDAELVRGVMLSLGTWNAQYRGKVIYDGINEVQYSGGDGTTWIEKDRTMYDRPFGAAPFVENNSSDNFLSPYRQDYSLALPAGGFYLGQNGVVLDLFQQWIWRFGLTPRLGRTVQVEVESKQGRIELRQTEVTKLDRAQAKGALV